MDLSLAIHVDPLLPVPALALLAAACVLTLGFHVWRGGRGRAVRLLAALILLCVLVNPQLVSERRTPLADVAVVVLDESASQDIAERTAQLETAYAALEERFGQFDDLEVRVISVGREDGEATKLFEPLSRRLVDVPPERVAGIILITDGQVHDVPADPSALGFDAPIHTLLTGEPGERDRRIAIVEAPRFGILGQSVRVVARIDALGTGAAAEGGRAQVTIRLDGETRLTRQVPLNTEIGFDIALSHPGANVLELAVEAGTDELTERNNRAVLVINGVRDRLRVLLVSGEPYQGERAWRNLLKADPAVDLVHFTILRPPHKYDGTAEDELALIDFPKHELFSEKLYDFDLIIFDRYRLRNVLSYDYFENIAGYVERGGALLVVAGPAFASRESLYRTPLARILPARPTGQVVERGFLPSLTEAGRRHPVTAPLHAADAQEPAPWGRWFRLVEASDGPGASLMTGADERPLLVLSRIGEGRIAQLLSDQLWLWSRGFEGGGPHAELMRRLAHWLMREPDLEEESLAARAGAGGLTIERRTMADSAGPISVTSPLGTTTQVTLSEAAPGLWQGRLNARETGVYTVRDGGLTAVAAMGSVNAREYADVRASEDALRPIVEASGGQIAWLAEAGVPQLRQVAGDRIAAGRGWIGLRHSGSYEVTASMTVPVLPAVLAILAALWAIFWAWRREAR